VSSNDAWNATYNEDQLKATNYYPSSNFKITTPGTYHYILNCSGVCGSSDRDSLSLANVEARYLPFWREIIPNLQGFLRGLF